MKTIIMIIIVIIAKIIHKMLLKRCKSEMEGNAIWHIYVKPKETKMLKSQDYNDCHHHYLTNG